MHQNVAIVGKKEILPTLMLDVFAMIHGVAFVPDTFQNTGQPLLILNRYGITLQC
jgi:hypothetical protein